MPMPVSRTEKRSRTSFSSFSTVATRIAISPRSVNFSALLAKIGQHLADQQRIADQPRRHLAIDIDDQFQPLGCRPLGDQPGDIVEHLVELEADPLDGHLAGLDFREIEDVVDDAEQVLARAPDLVEVTALTRRHVGLQREMRHADDRVHRRADFVAHVGQEFRLGARGILGQFARPFDFLERRAFGADVVDDPHRAPGRILRIDRVAGHPGPELRAVLADHALFAPVHLAVPDLRIGLAPGQFEGLRVRVPQAGRPADQTAVGAAEQLVHPPVAADDGTVLQQHDARRRRIEDRLLLPGQFAERPLGGAVRLDFGLQCRALGREVVQRRVQPADQLAHLRPERTENENDLEQQQQQRAQPDPGFDRVQPTDRRLAFPLVLADHPIERRQQRRRRQSDDLVEQQLGGRQVVRWQCEQGLDPAEIVGDQAVDRRLAVEVHGADGRRHFRRQFHRGIAADQAEVGGPHQVDAGAQFLAQGRALRRVRRHVLDGEQRAALAEHALPAADIDQRRVAFLGDDHQMQTDPRRRR